VRRFVLFVVTLLFVCAASAWLAGCPATATLGIAPITGVGVPISTILIESNLGCGYGPNDVYKYAVVVDYPLNDSGAPSIDECPNSKPSATQLFVPGAVFNCFAEATFGNLPLQDAGEGGLTYVEGGGLPDGARVELWAWVSFYNYETFKKLTGKLSLRDETIESRAQGGDICSIGATWATACTATEEDDIVANLACQPLVQGKYAPEPEAAPPGDVQPQDATSEGTFLDAGADASADATAG
jgi:hypothetical protein